jgi:site-specific DNA recombinase
LRGTSNNAKSYSHTFDREPADAFTVIVGRKAPSRWIVKENSSTAQSQEEYLKKYDSLNKRYEDIVCELEKQKEERTSRQQQDKAMSTFTRTLRKNPQVLEEWDDTIWTVMVDKGIVGTNGGIRFLFNNGAEIEVGGE